METFFSRLLDSSRKFHKNLFISIIKYELYQHANFHDNIKFRKDAGYFERDPNLFKKFFNMISEDYKKLYSFIDAIRFLAQNNEEFDIVLRPHPTENIKAWEIFLDGLPNVHIIRSSFQLGLTLICSNA